MLWAGIYILAPGLSLAQSAQTPAAGTSGDTLQEVIVTAQRREENLQRIGVAVEAVSAQELTTGGVEQPEDLSRLVPALQIIPASGPYTLFYLRGVGSFNGNALSDSGVALNLDGVYDARPSSTSGIFYDVDRVEVLKGPQGTLYGRNATGGAINVITKDPEMRDGLDGEVEVGNYGLARGSGALNMQINDRVALRGAFQVVGRNGYMTDGSDDDQTQSGRMKLRIDATDDLRVILGVDFTHQGGVGVGATLLTGPDRFISNNPWVGSTDPRVGARYAQTLDFTAGATLAPLPEDPQATAHCVVYDRLNPDLSCPLSNNQPYLNDTYWGTYGTLTWNAPAGTLTVIPAYRHSLLDYMNTESSFRIDQTEQDEQSSLEMRFASAADRPLAYLLGGYYLHEGIQSNPSYDQEYNYSAQDLSLRTDSAAGFGRLTWTVIDGVRLIGGARYTYERKQASGVDETLSTVCPGVFVPPPFGPNFCFGGVGQVTAPTPTITLNASNSWSRATWRGAAEWDVAPQSLLYGSVETGFKSGGFYFSSTNPVYQPETVTAYTIGSKNRFLGESLQVNLEGFYWDYRNQQLSHLGYDATGTITFPTNNVGHATIRGFETELQYRLTRDTQVGADIQYLDAYYNDFQYTVPYFGTPPTTGCPYSIQPGPPPVALLNCSGQVAPESPKWTVNLNAQQTAHLGFGDLSAEVQSHYQSATATGQDFLPIEVQKGVWIVDAALTFQSPGRHWTLTGYVRNIGNSAQILSTFLQPLTGAALPVSAVGPPRTFGAIFGVHL